MKDKFDTLIDVINEHYMNGHPITAGDLLKVVEEVNRKYLEQKENNETFMSK